MKASRALRRAPAEAVVPALMKAIEGHKDQFVRFRALVLLLGFNDSRTAELVRQTLADPNDRLRDSRLHVLRAPSVGERDSCAAGRPRAGGKRVCATGARSRAGGPGSRSKVRETLLVEVGRGQDFFRSAVIEALGDYRALYAIEPIMGVARLSGPLQVDAVIALGKLKRSTGDGDARVAAANGAP